MSKRVAKSEVTVGLQSVTPVIPKDLAEKEQLEADLKKMGCEGLLKEPWGLKSREMAQEFLRESSN